MDNGFLACSAIIHSVNAEQKDDVMNRREFMKAGIGGAVAVAASSLTMKAALSAKPTTQAKPNIVFILADDCTYNVLGCYGGKTVKTPNIDRLAAEGLTLNRAYAAMAMCAPFRAELYTGLYPARNGVTWNHSATRPGTKSVSQYLEGLGYRVGLTGKRHFTGATNMLKGFPVGEKVRNFVKADPNQPFCLFVCSKNPHAPWSTGDASQFDAGKIELPPAVHDNPRTREAMTRYLAEVGDLDREVGEVLKMLADTGLTEDTLVMFSSEQGWAFGFAKWTNWNLGIHTAMIARWPGRIKPGTRTDAMVQIADVTPTFIELAGGDPARYNLDGSSFVKVLTGEARTHRKYIYGMHNNVPEGEPYPIRSVRDSKYHYLINLTPDRAYHEKHVMTATSRLVWWPALEDAAKSGRDSAKAMMARFRNRPAEELYRTDEDPYELNNLAGDPSYAEVKATLRAELKLWMAKQKDPGAALDTRKAYDANAQAHKQARKSAGKNGKKL